MHRGIFIIFPVSLRVPKCMSKRSRYVSRKRHYRLSLLLVTRPLVVSDSSRVREVHSRFFAKYYSIPVKRYHRYWIDWDSWVHIELRPIPTLGHSPFSLSLSLSRIHTQTHTHAYTPSLHSPRPFFSFSFPFSVVRRVVFVSVYRVRVPLQFFGFIYFASSSLFPYSSFVRASFDSTLYIDRRCRALIFACRAPKKKKGTYAIVCVSILHRNPSRPLRKSWAPFFDN